MPFCPECGKPVAANAKFCRSCGASQLDDVVPPNLPAPAAAPVPVPAPAIPVQPVKTPPAPLQTVVQPISQSVCSSCGSSLFPSEKFCGICGTRAGQIAIVPTEPAPAPVYAPVPPASQFQSPAPVIGEPTSVRTCRACGNMIKPGDKYCSKCLVMVRDNPPQAAPPTAVPATNKEQPSPTTAPGSYVCASCNSPITGTEKFCGICGAIVAARVPVPENLQPFQKTCSVCGAPVNDTTKFCGGCGAPVGASFRSAAVATPDQYSGVAPAVPKGGEQIIGVIGNARKMKLLGAAWDTYALVVTDRRMILAQLTADRLNAAYKEAAEKAKVEGKGFLAQWTHQMSVAFHYCLKYETMPPEFALAETKGNRAIENMRITAVNMKEKPAHQGSIEYQEFIMTIQSPDGKFEFCIGEDDRFINILKTAYGEKVHMPFGYFSAGGARIDLF